MRELAGDFLHGSQKSVLVGGDEEIFCCFSALFQGDHLGVEYATDAHANLLISHGLILQECRLQSDRPLVSDELVSGLVIDDFFVISKEPAERSEVYENSRSHKQFLKAKEVYAKERIFGSDDKDVIAASTFKACGGEVVSTYEAVRSGVVSLAAPFEKRVALSAISMTAASWKYTTDALHACLVGSWVSVTLLRRQAMSVMNDVFKVIPPAELSPEDPRLRFLPRSAAEELQLLASLALVLSSNLAVPFDEEIYATDASNERGGICSARVSAEASAVLWRTAERRREPVPMQSQAQVILSSYDSMFESLPQMKSSLDGIDELCGLPEEEGEGGLGFSGERQFCQRPIGMRFQFIELCGGAGGVTRELIRRGIACGPVLDLSLSQQFNLAEHRVIQWLCFMMEDDRLDSFLVSPPCTTFSPAAHPCVRSYKQPRGFDQRLWKVWIGNLLAFAALTCLFVALRLEKFGLGEQPRRSKMRWLEEWRRLLMLGAREVFLASCMYGSPHQKEFCFVGANMYVELLHRACSRDHQHVRIQGQYTKPSAVYCDGLVLAIATLFEDHLRARQSAVERLTPAVSGLEDVLTNDFALSSDWRTLSSWRWSGRSHINVLEAAACLKLLRDLAKRGGDLRVTVLLDSHVALSCFVRGRSSAKSLQHLLKKAASLCLACGIYPAFRYVPTRLNPADAPSRDLRLPDPVDASLAREVSSFVAHGLSSVSGLRRWAANWARLVLLLQPSIVLFLGNADVRKNPKLPISLHEWTLDFDSTLGFPGEGPLWLSWIFGFSLALGPCQLVLGVGVSHGDDVRKLRRAGIVLEEGRRVTETTANVREVLFGNFCEWLTERDLVFEHIFMPPNPDLDSVNKILVQYGKWLFAQGKPYYHFSECINLVTSRRPLLRRSLQQAWDLCFLWGSYEPVEHHIAMPHQILVSLIAAALWWGWVREAAVFALAWGALLRIGEVYQATRADLILPGDVDGTNNYALLRIKEPKTRFRAARHQAGRLEHADLLEVVRIGFERLLPHEKLWPWSRATLRSRFTKLLLQLGLPTELHQCPKPLTLASFRPGGASYMISICDNAEAVRRRGRWASFKVMEVYLQEVGASTYMNMISDKSKSNVLNGLKVFPTLLQRIHGFFECRIPANTWVFLLRKAAGDDLKV